MPRYRPPAAAKSAYITQEGYSALDKELQSLWLRRRDVTAALAAAAAEGDRSENAEYIYRKKELREIDRRIRYLQKRLPQLKIVEPRDDHSDTIYFGAWVELEDEQQHHCYRIVGPDEFDPKRRWISMDSPMAKALLGRQIDDDIQVQTPQGLKEYSIIAVHYRPPGNE